MNQVAQIQRPSLIAKLASVYNLEPTKFANIVKSTCMPSNKPVSDEEFAAFLMVADKHNLNPITREIYAFPKKGGGIQPIVSIDGWMTLINSHADFDGMEFNDALNDKGELVSITCSMYRKDRTRPVSVTEYMNECKRATEPWQKWPARMLRHKAAIQAARYAFSFSGIIEPEEAERSPDVITEKVVAPPPPVTIDADLDFDPNDYFDELRDNINASQTPDELDEQWKHYMPEEQLKNFPDHLEQAFKMKIEKLEELKTA
jgi:phage recombination protein Bet